MQKNEGDSVSSDKSKEFVKSTPSRLSVAKGKIKVTKVTKVEAWRDHSKFYRKVVDHAKRHGKASTTAVFGIDNNTISKWKQMLQNGDKTAKPAIPTNPISNSPPTQTSQTQPPKKLLKTSTGAKIPVVMVQAKPPQAPAAPLATTNKTPEVAIDEELRLNWNTHYEFLSSSFSALLADEQFTDITLWVEDQPIRCHKLILSSCSSFFEKIIRSQSQTQTPFQSPVIYLHGISYAVLKALVDFMYFGEIMVKKSALPDLFSAAETLKIKSLSAPASQKSKAYVPVFVPQTKTLSNDTQKPAIVVKPLENAVLVAEKPSVKLVVPVTTTINDKNQTKVVDKVDKTPEKLPQVDGSLVKEKDREKDTLPRTYQRKTRSIVRSNTKDPIKEKISEKTDNSDEVATTAVATEPISDKPTGTETEKISDDKMVKPKANDSLIILRRNKPIVHQVSLIPVHVQTQTQVPSVNAASTSATENVPEKITKNEKLEKDAEAQKATKKMSTIDEVIAAVASDTHDNLGSKDATNGNSDLVRVNVKQEFVDIDDTDVYYGHFMANQQTIPCFYEESDSEMLEETKGNENDKDTENVNDEEDEEYEVPLASRRKRRRTKKTTKIN